MRYCANCEKSFTCYLKNTTKRNIIDGVVFLIVMIFTIIIIIKVRAGSEAALEPEPTQATIIIKPGDPIAPRNSEN